MKSLIELKDMSQTVLECVSAPETQRVFDGETSDFVRGAMWGMSWAAMYVNLNCPYYLLKEGENTNA